MNKTIILLLYLIVTLTFLSCDNKKKQTIESKSNIESKDNPIIIDRSLLNGIWRDTDIMYPATRIEGDSIFGGEVYNSSPFSLAHDTIFLDYGNNNIIFFKIMKLDRDSLVLLNMVNGYLKYRRQE